MFVRNQVREAWPGLPAGSEAAGPRSAAVDARRADRLVPLTAMTAAERWLEAPHQVVSLPGVGHLPHEEAPDAVTAAILDWLQPSASVFLNGPIRWGKERRTAPTPFAELKGGSPRTGNRTPPGRNAAAGPTDRRCGAAGSRL